MVHQVLFDHFHRRMGEISREWRMGLTIGTVQDNDGMLDAICVGVLSAMDELRAEVRALAKDFPGDCLVPV